MEGRSNRHQGKRVAGAIRHLAIVGMSPKRQPRQFNRGNQFSQAPDSSRGPDYPRAACAGLTNARLALARRAAQMHRRVKSRQRHVHVRRMSRRAGGGCPKNGVVPVESLPRIAALPRIASVAARTVIVVEVGAACTLQNVATDGRRYCGFAPMRLPGSPAPARDTGCARCRCSTTVVLRAAAPLRYGTRMVPADSSPEDPLILQIRIKRQARDPRRHLRAEVISNARGSPTAVWMVTVGGLRSIGLQRPSSPLPSSF